MSATAQQLLDELRALGVEVVAAGDKLRFHPAGAVPPDLKRLLKEGKRAVLDLLRVGSGGDADAEEPPTAGELTAIQRRLAAILEGRLWKDSAGWWPKDTGLPRSRAEHVAAEAMRKEPPPDLPPPKVMTAARGPVAVRAWRQVVGCLISEVAWTADRAGPAAALVVDPCFGLALDESDVDEALAVDEEIP